MRRTVYADADRDGLVSTFALDQNAREFNPIKQKIIRPFNRKASFQAGRDLNKGVVNGKPCDQRELRPALGARRRGEEQGGVEIARLRNPASSAPAAA